MLSNNEVGAQVLGKQILKTKERHKTFTIVSFSSLVLLYFSGMF